MTSDEFRTLASTVYGRTWQAELARALHINVRTVRRWASGDLAIPAARAAEIMVTLRMRAAQSFRDMLTLLTHMD